MKMNHGLMNLMAAVLAGVLLCAACAACAEEKVVYESSFKKGVDGWFAYGDDVKVGVTGSKKSVAIKGRADDWNGLRREFVLEAGVPHYISVDVLQKGQASATFMLSCARTVGGDTTYANLAVSEVQKDKWTTLETMWIPGQYDSLELYVETRDAPSLSFEIRNFRVLTGVSLGDRFAAAYDGKYGKKKGREALEKLKDIPWPEFMKTAGTDFSAWLPKDERPEIASVKELTYEDKTLSLTVDREVENIEVLEYPSGQDYNVVYSSKEDKNNKNRKTSATVKLVNPVWDTVLVNIFEQAKEDNEIYVREQRGELRLRPLQVDIKNIRIGYPVPREEIPPYDIMDKASMYWYVNYRGDGSVAEVEYGFHPSETGIYASVETDLNGQPQSCYIYRNTFQGQKTFSTHTRVSRDKGVTQVDFRTSDNLDATILYLGTDNMDYYGWRIQLSYPDADLWDKDLKIWLFAVDTTGDLSRTEQYFLTRDELFTVNEHGSVYLNTEAKDLYGNPFGSESLLAFMGPELCEIPLLW